MSVCSFLTGEKVYRICNLMLLGLLRLGDRQKGNRAGVAACVYHSSAQERSHESEAILGYIVSFRQSLATKNLRVSVAVAVWCPCADETEPGVAAEGHRGAPWFIYSSCRKKTQPCGGRCWWRQWHGGGWTLSSGCFSFVSKWETRSLAERAGMGGGSDALRREE